MKEICQEADVDRKKKSFLTIYGICSPGAFMRWRKNLALLADILGHSSIETTRIYVAEGARKHERILKKMHLII